jgi:hypothetical protein
MNVTATNEQEGGYLTIYPAGSARPTSSNVNFAAHRSTPGLTVARPGANGAVTVFNGSGGSVDVVLDVFGFDAPSTTGATYAPVTPTRRLDTRTTVGGHRSKAVARETLTLATGAPDGATAVGLNVTVTEPTSGGYLTLWAGDGPWPATSNVNFVAKQTVANLVVAPVDDNGAVHIRNGSLGSTHVVADVAGYYLPNASASPYHADTPHRLLDTRAHGGTVPSGGYRDVLIAPSPFSTTGLSAVVLTVTAVKGDGQGYLTAYPSNVTRPTASNVNYVPGVSRANLVMVRLTSTRTVRIFNGGSRPVHVVVDQAGHFTAH